MHDFSHNCCRPQARFSSFPWLQSQLQETSGEVLVISLTLATAEADLKQDYRHLHDISHNYSRPQGKVLSFA